eukprot:gene6684-8000_t
MFAAEPMNTVPVWEANSYCEDQGARLCTLEEVQMVSETPETCQRLRDWTEHFLNRDSETGRSTCRTEDEASTEREIRLDEASTEREIRLDEASTEREIRLDEASAEREIRLDEASAEREIRLDEASAEREIRLGEASADLAGCGG